MELILHFPTFLIFLDLPHTASLLVCYRCVLAAVVLSQVVGTIFDDKHTLRKLTGPDRFLGFATAAATAATSPTYGILIGCALALAVSLVASGKNKPTKGKSV